MTNQAKVQDSLRELRSKAKDLNSDGYQFMAISLDRIANELESALASLPEPSKHPAMKALESLTPGGSEFVDDIEACVAHVKARQRGLMEQLRKRASLPEQAGDDLCGQGFHYFENGKCTACGKLAAGESAAQGEGK